MTDESIKEVERVFNINNIKTAMIGGTMIGLDPSVGSSSNTTTTNSVIPLDVPQYLNLYSELNELEKSQGNPFDSVGLSTIWNVGFTSTNEKISTPDFFSGNSCKYLKNRKLRTADQLFSRRSESSTAALFSCFKLKNSKKRIVECSSMSPDMEEFLRYGLICNSWIKNPQTIHYVTSVRGSDKSRDYLYLIGSDSDEFFNPPELMECIFRIHKENETLEKNSENRKVPADIKNLVESLMNNDRIWVECKLDTIPEATLKHPYVGLALNLRLLARAMHGVFNFYNYLIHAHKQLNLTNVYETNEDTLGKPVKIEQLLKEYEPIYTYCKNLYFYTVI